MCGRYASDLPPDFIARLFGTTNPTPNVEPSWNVSPSQDAAVVRREPRTGERHLSLLRWGLLPNWTTDPAKAKRPINARAETVATTGMFRGAYAQRRCLVPATAFYEWTTVDGGKQPYAIARLDGKPLVFAGLWEGFRWPNGDITRSFTIVTTRASADIVTLHERMPVILDASAWPYWLGEIPGSVDEFLAPAPAGTLRYWPVSKAVNTPRNNMPEMLAPLA